MVKKVAKDVAIMTGASVGIGAGALVVDKLGSPVAVGGGLSSMASHMGTLGTVAMAGHLMRKTQEAMPMAKKRKKRKKRR